MTAKGHITLQKYCFYVSWQNLDLNFQPCRLQNSNKINRRFVRPKRRFGKMKRRFSTTETAFYKDCFVLWEHKRDDVFVISVQDIVSKR